MPPQEQVVKFSTEELLKRSERPSKLALDLHPYYEGKIQVFPKAAIRNYHDFSIWYTPGVAAPCKEIAKDPDLSFYYTNRWNTVAVVSDGTRVLGLGDIGPEAALPVMEGKALLFKYLGGVDAFPVVLGTNNLDEIVRTVKLIEPSFGGINLEDISSPKCYFVLEELQKQLSIPVWHDDQQGTATVIYAGLVNALKLVGKKRNEVKIVMYGAGAANSRAAKILIEAGFNGRNMYLIDSKGILYPERPDLLAKKEQEPMKWMLANKTNAEGLQGGPEKAFEGADIVVAASRPGPDVIKKEWIRKMADKPIVFATANPIPEIFPWDAKEAGAYIVATGRGDFPNQINNSLGFPGIFRGTLDVRAKRITDEMCIAAGDALAEYAEKKGIHPGYIIPTMDEWEVYIYEALAAAEQCMKQGVARLKPSHAELEERIRDVITSAHQATIVMMKEGIIKPFPPGTGLLDSIPECQIEA